MAIKINLLPREARAARTGRAAAPTSPRAGVSAGLLTKILGGVFVLMLLAMSLLGYRAWSTKRDYQTQITSLKAQNEQLKGQLNELDQAEKAKVEIQRRIEVIGKVAKSQGVPLAMLNGVLRAVPQGVWLYGVDMKPQEIKVRVEEQTAATMSETLGRLEAKRTEVEGQAARPPQRGQAGHERGLAARGVLRGHQGRGVQQLPDRRLHGQPAQGWHLRGRGLRGDRG